MLFSLRQTKHSSWWWVVFSALYGLVFHIHLSMTLVLFVAIYWALTHKKTLNAKIIILSIIAFTIVISPLVGFDYFHKFTNITAPVRVIQAIGKTKNKFDPITRSESLLKAVSRIFYLQAGKSNTDEILYPCNAVRNNNSTKIFWPIVILLILLLCVGFKKKEFLNDTDKKLVIIYSFAYIIPFIFLPSIGAVEYYLLGFFPLMILITAYSITNLKKRSAKIAYLILILFIIQNILTVFLADTSFGIKTKKIMIEKIMDYIDGSTFELVETGGPCQGTAGWGYLFSIYGRSPDKNTADKQFSWLVPIGNDEETKYLVIINERRSGFDMTNTQTTKKLKKLINQGGFTAYIFENQSSPSTKNKK
jgi:hypothetical protein